MINTTYKTALAYIDFDSKLAMQSLLGQGTHYDDLLIARKDFALQKRGIYFVTPGPVNLALCSTSSSSIPLHTLSTNCIVQGTCSKRYTLSFWSTLPSHSALKETEEITLADIGVLTIGLKKNARLGCTSGTKILSLFANVTSSNTTCRWDIGKHENLIGVWTHYVVSVDASARNLVVYLNGNKGFANKTGCDAYTKRSTQASVGGGAAMLCFDEVSLWQKAFQPGDARLLYHAVAPNGRTLS